MPSMRNWVAAGVVHLILVLGMAEAVFAQGSIGGTLGKPDQELSGDRPAPPPAKAPEPAAKVPEPKLSLSGKWTWQSTCSGGSASKGEFQIDHGSDGALKGTCKVSGGAVPCGDISGQVA